MTELNKPGLSPPPEDLVADSSQLNIQNIVKEEQVLNPEPGDSTENQVSLADLHQTYIDGIAKFLDPKSLVRLQLTCKSLFEKGAAAQRLLTLTPHTIEYWTGRNMTNNAEINGMKFCHHNFTLNKAQFKSTDFRLRAQTLRKCWIPEDFTPEICEYIDETLNGRGTIKELNLYLTTSTVDAIRFNKFLQDFNISELVLWAMPVDCFNQPSVQKLERLVYDDFFPLPLSYISDSVIHSGGFTFCPNDFDNDVLNVLLKKWVVNEKVIKKLVFQDLYCFEFELEQTFANWRIINEEEEVPRERPIVIQDGHHKFRLLRADETTLYISYEDYNVVLSIDGYSGDSSSSDVDIGDSDYDDRFNVYWYDSDSDT